MEKAFLILATGETIEGNHIGATGCSIGELVFTTGMEGYTETLTDPSYAGQTVIQTFPLIGNYGVNAEDCEGVPALSGYVVSECCDTPSNFRAECTVDVFLKEHGICGISGIDTRYLTKMIRDGGTVNAAVTDSLPEDIGGLVGKLKNYSVSGAVGKVSTKKSVVYPAYGEKKFSVVLVDYGAKKNITESLRKLGCEVTVVPHDTGAEKILALCPDGVMLSNGPGDPAENVGCIAEIKKLIGKVPVFGICLGHQLTALAMGAKTGKLPFGHRGGNQPVRDALTGRTYMTSQNHGYAVIPESLSGIGDISFVNMNDGSCEGVSYTGKYCFTVQFHPEAHSGPHDTGFLFGRFVSMMEDFGNAKG